MRFSKFFLCMVSVTTVALIYTKLQIQILDLAYQGSQKERRIQDLRDYNSHVHYMICSLKSASNLGGKLLSDDREMKFVDEEQVVLVRTPLEKPKGEAIAMSELSRPHTSFLLQLFSLKAQAEAKTLK